MGCDDIVFLEPLNLFTMLNKWNYDIVEAFDSVTKLVKKMFFRWYLDMISTPLRSVC